MGATLNRRYVETGETVRVRLPYSEVCMSMRVAGTVMLVRLQAPTWLDGISVVPGTLTDPVVQLLCDDEREFSAPILLGEAGFWRDETGRIYTLASETLAPPEEEAPIHEHTRSCHYLGISLWDCGQTDQH